jgi:hypothetical protein
VVQRGFFPTRYNVGMKMRDARQDVWLLGVSIFFCLTFWYWTTHIYVPANAAEVRARHLPVGNNSDLYPRWLGARELLLHHRDPYSPEITREIQTGFYGRPLNPQAKSDPQAQESFVYPLWVVFLLAPVVTMPFGLVIEIFRWVLLGSIVLSVALWSYSFGFRLRPLIVLSGVLLTLSSLPSLVEYYQQNLTALFLLFAAAGTACIVRHWLAFGGLLLALVTMKPDTCCLVVIWFLVWACSKWTERSRLIWTFAATMAFLVITSEIILPRSTASFIAAVREYPTYGTSPNILQMLLPSSLGVLSSLLLLSLLFTLWLRWRTAHATTPEFRSALAWTCVVTLALIPKLASYNQFLLLPPLMTVLAQLRNFQIRGVIRWAFVSAPFACLLIQWLAASILTLSSILSQHTLSRFVAELPYHISLALVPLTLFAMAVTAFLPQTARPRARQPLLNSFFFSN